MDQIRARLREQSPELICNGRMTGGYGDYATPEQGVPVVPPPGPWELCLTLNDNWGFRHHDTNFKSVAQVVRIFTEVISAGGNLLLDFGPLVLRSAL